MNDLLAKPPVLAAGKQHARKTVMLWLLLVFMFASLYQVTSRPAGAGHRHLAARPDLFAQALDWMPRVMFGLLVCGFGFTFWRMRQFPRQRREALELFNQGAYGKAAAAFDAIAKRNVLARGWATVQAGTAWMRAGDLTRALERLAPAAKKPMQPCPAAALGELAVVEALRGHVAQAQTHLANLKAGPNEEAYSLAWARSLVAARAGDAALVRQLDDKWRELERALPAETMRRLLLLRAFSEARSQGVRAGGDYVVRLRASALPGEFAWLAGGWPELAQFLATHGLS